MKKLMEKFDVKMIVTIVIIVAMTCIGVHYMEYEWCEDMSGIMWIIGELMVVVALTTKDMTKFIIKEINVLYDKLLELED